MSIYDPILQAYRGGIDRQMALRQQQPSLAQAILQGYGQGRQFAQQDWQRNFQERQFAEQQRHAQEQERLQGYGIDAKAQAQQRALEMKARLQGQAEAVKQAIAARTAELKEEENDLRSRGLDQEATKIAAQVKLNEAQARAIDQKLSHQINLIDAQADRAWNYRPMDQPGLLGAGTVGQEGALLGLLGRTYAGEVAQRGQTMASPGGKIGSLEAAPENVDLGSAIDTLLSRLDDLKKLRGAGAGAAKAKIVKGGGQRNVPSPAAPAPPQPAPAVPSADTEVPPAPWE